MITYLQNGWGWKRSLEVSWTNTACKAGSPEPVAQDCVQKAFECLHRWRFILLSLWATRSHAQSPSEKVKKVDKCFLTFQWKFLCFSLCPLSLVLSVGTPEKSLALPCLHPPFRYLSRSCLSLLQAEQPQVFQPFLLCEMLQSLNELSGPSLDSLQ